MRYKSLLDTNVLIAASIHKISEDLSIKLKHPFFDQSMRLIGLLRRNLSKRIGIVTATVEEEAHFVLEQAVREEIEKRITNRALDFQIFSVILNSCENRLRDILSYLLREPVDPLEVSRNFVKVTEMYETLMERARNLPKPAALLAEMAPVKLRKLAFDIYRTQDEILNSQLTNLLRNPVDTIDKTILSQAVYLLKLYRQTEGKDVTFFLVSTDHHFSPVRKKGFESRPVTNYIQDLFEVICDWPDQIEQILRKDIG